MKKYCFDPIVNESCKILILGSMPGEESLRKQQYYGHPRNAFWRILNEDLPRNSYEEKCSFLLDHGIALWDVLSSAHRQGSLDSAIKNETPNDFYSFLNKYLNIQKICFNGGKAESSFKKYFEDLYENYTCTRLPSTSPAYTLSFDEKKKTWRSVLSYYL